MRPRGEIRQAIAKAAAQLLQGCLQVTYRDLAAAAKVGFAAARKVIKNMVRDGELEPVGSVQVPGSRRPLNAYRLGGGRDRITLRLDLALRGLASLT
jgi:hypothetical protein